MSAGERLHLRLFLEGMEVPVIAAQVQSNLNAPATASIQVVPTDAILNLKPRTMVHLFFYDTSTETVSDDTEAQLQDYKLLFGGEVVGVSFAKTPLSRQAILQCADWSTYWDVTYQMMISYGPNGNFLTEESAAWAGGSSLFNDIIDGHSAVMNSYLRRKPMTAGLQNVKGLMGGIISLLEAMGGVPRHVHGVNDFFTIAELKNHLLQQITAEQNDNTAQRLFDAREFMAWLERGITSLGELVTFRDMLKLMFSWIYYEAVPVVCPRFIPGVDQLKRKAKKRVPTGYTDDVDTKLEEIASACRRQYIDSGYYNEATQRQKFQSNINLAFDCVKKLRAIKEIKDLPSVIIRGINKAVDFLARITDDSNTATGQILGRYLGRMDFLNAAKALEDARAKAQKTIVISVTKTQPAELPRLQTQIFRPDCFFASPPKCNILFPEQYSSFSFSRNFLNEVTRLRLQTSMVFVGNDKLLSNFFYAPALKQIKEQAAKQGGRGLRTLLPWEIYSGILPKFETVSEVNYIANQRERQIKKNVKGQAISYSQRAANFNYMKYRFASRTIDVSGRFNPNVVLGFPGMVLDRPFILDKDSVTQALKQQAESVKNTSSGDILGNIHLLAQTFDAPTQYLGMVSGLSHMVDQGGGNTSISMTHARTHRIDDDDFLTLYAAQMVKDSGKHLVSTVLDATDLAKSGDYKLLKFLIDATPQDIPHQMKNLRYKDDVLKVIGETSDSDIPLSVYDTDRPTSRFLPADLNTLAPLLQVTTAPVTAGIELSNGQTATDESGNTDFQYFRGPTKKTEMDGTSTSILIPEQVGQRLKPGMKGPRGGKIKYIQLRDDSVSQIKLADLKTEELGKTGKTRSTNKNLKGVGKTAYAWNRAVIFEEVVTRNVLNTIPPEECLRPPWFSPLYSNMFIGDNIYQPFFGTGALVDMIAFGFPGGESAITEKDKKKRQDLLDKLQAADGDLGKIQEALASADPKIISQVPSIEDAADTLAYIYGEVKRQELDAAQFVASYTHRPIATMQDIFGSSDFTYDANGQIASGIPGFHSAAVAPFSELKGLIDNPDQPLPRLHIKGKKFVLSTALDPRPGRRQAVQAYVDSLGAGVGSLGVGLQG